jgi:hypothetical protein
MIGKSARNPGTLKTMWIMIPHIMAVTSGKVAARKLLANPEIRAASNLQRRKASGQRKVLDEYTQHFTLSAA